MVYFPILFFRYIFHIGHLIALQIFILNFSFLLLLKKLLFLLELWWLGRLRKEGLLRKKLVLKQDLIRDGYYCMVMYCRSSLCASYPKDCLELPKLLNLSVCHKMAFAIIGGVYSQWSLSQGIEGADRSDILLIM